MKIIIESDESGKVTITPDSNYRAVDVAVALGVALDMIEEAIVDKDMDLEKIDEINIDELWK